MVVMRRLELVPSLPSSAVTTERDCLAVFCQEFDYLCRTLRRLGVHQADVEDLVHEVFLVLQRKWEDYDPSRPSRPYLFGIAFRVASAHHRRRIREVPSDALEVEDQGPLPDQSLQAKQARAIVLRALERLPLARRAVFIMHDLDEVPMRDIAAVLSIPVFTAYSRLRKARKEFVFAVGLIRKVTGGP
jgi:RNA polymerase sigma-70 factor (ECF subfamily)